VVQGSVDRGSPLGTRSAVTYESSMSQNTELSSNATGGSPAIRVTERAARWVLDRHSKLGQPNAALRVGVKGGGCAGYTYVTDATQEPPNDRDEVLEFYGLRVYVDRRSLRLIGGSTLDLHKSLMQTGLHFQNPHEASTCGCGATFSVKDD
jgi:iron-sulfur cluster assembly protein